MEFGCKDIVIIPVLITYTNPKDFIRVIKNKRSWGSAGQRTPRREDLRRLHRKLRHLQLKCELSQKCQDKEA